MNKPATKEPSMDEILSSIRQIIADDDSGLPPARAASPVPASTPAFSPAPPARQNPAPFALSPSQMMPPDPEPEPYARAAEPLRTYGVPAMDEPAEEHADYYSPPAQLVDPEDVAFEADPVEEERAPPPPPEPVVRRPDPTPPTPDPRRQLRPAAPVSRMAPMPDPKLSEDLAEQLLEPTTEAAVQGNLSRLSGISSMASGQTVEGMMRDLLRPMLKGWLDENLPAIVERMVEKEIARISRGVK